MKHEFKVHRHPYNAYYVVPKECEGMSFQEALSRSKGYNTPPSAKLAFDPEKHHSIISIKINHILMPKNRWRRD